MKKLTITKTYTYTGYQVAGATFVLTDEEVALYERGQKGEDTDEIEALMDFLDQEFWGDNDILEDEKDDFYEVENEYEVEEVEEDEAEAA